MSQESPIRLLLPVDFSSAMEDQLQMASYLAERAPVATTLLHAAPPLVGLYPQFAEPTGYAAMQAEQKQQAQQALDEAAQHPLLQSCSAATELMDAPEGDLIACMEQVMDKQAPDMIVAVAKEEDGLQRLLLGSYLQRLLLLREAPVLVVPQGKARRPKRVLFATDLSLDALPCFLGFMPLAQRLDLEVRLLRVATPGQFEGERHFFERVHAFMQAAQQAQPGVEKHMGPPLLYNAPQLEQGLLHAAEDYLADWLVTATHGHTGLRRWLSGSVTQALIAERNLPVLVYNLFE